MSDAKHEVKTCPRCEMQFECKSGSILLCQCQSLSLTSQQQEYIEARFEDCLCLDCLKDLRSDYNKIQHQQKIEKLIR